LKLTSTSSWDPFYRPNKVFYPPNFFFLCVLTSAPFFNCTLSPLVPLRHSRRFFYIRGISWHLYSHVIVPRLFCFLPRSPLSHGHMINPAFLPRESPKSDPMKVVRQNPHPLLHPFLETVFKFCAVHPFFPPPPPLFSLKSPHADVSLPNQGGDPRRVLLFPP